MLMKLIRNPTEDSFFHRVAGDNPAGLPPWLLHGGWGSEEDYKTPCWSEYSDERIALLPERYAGLFSLN
jgi:hypothetical protein